MEPVQQDYTGVSLDDYIKNNPQVLNDIKVKTSKLRIRPPSQQWRLGRNGNRPLKRLGRVGPLRPSIPYQGQNARLDDGLPKLVLRRYHSLHPGSVFHRLGWNPLRRAAWQKLQHARFYGLRQRLNYPAGPRSYMFHWGRRPYLPPWAGFNRMGWTRRAHNFQGGYGQHQHMSTKDLLKLQRMKNQRRQQMLLQKQIYQRAPFNNQMSNRPQPRQYNVPQSFEQSQPRQYNVPQSFEQPQPRQYNVPQSFDQQRIAEVPLSLSSEAARRQYPIARDDYMPPLDRKVRPPSPVGSIVSTLSRTQTMQNPFRSTSQPPAFNSFAKPPSQASGHKTFESTSRGPVSNFSNVPMNSAFRPTPSTTNISCTQRFANTRSDMFQNMYMAVE